MVNLVTVKDRELMKVGKYSLSTGDFECTTELIQAAITAHNAGVLRKPVVRLGHNDPRFSGDPAVGWFDNLRVSADGSTLYGDHHGVPKWLADNMASAYPSLSIEGMYNYTAPDGTPYEFVLTGVGLLGATDPGIGSLKSVQDLESLYDTAEIAAAVGEIGGTPVQLVQAATTVADTERPVMASLKEKLAEKFGLDPDLPEDAILEAIAKSTEEAPQVTAAEPQPELPLEQPAPVAASAPAPEAVALQKDQYDVLMAAAAEVHKIRAEQAAENRERLVMAAIADGRITHASKGDWLKALEVDPGEHNKVALASLAPGFVPVREMGHANVAPGGVEASASPDGDAHIMEYASSQIRSRLGIPASKGSDN